MLKRKSKFLDEYENNGVSSGERRRSKTSCEDIINLCLSLLREATGRRINVIGTLITEMALKCAEELAFNAFQAGNGWLDGFVKRNNIVFKTMLGERGDVKINCVEDWEGHFTYLNDAI
ncbi:hypothetical protein ACF0H5_021404 [Mactra antiquata]